MSNKQGTLFLIPTPIAEGSHLNVLPPETISVLPKLSHFLVENTKSARRFLKRAGYPHSFDETWFFEINEHNQFEINAHWLQPLKDGKDVGLLSEAGLPCVADPGYTVVRLAHEFGFKVVPLGGPSSLMKALMASGLNGQQFVFHGYLPVKPDDLKRSLKKLEENARLGFTQIFIETPYRNDRMLEMILAVCRLETRICIAAAIDTEQEDIRTASVSVWKKSKHTLKGLPTVFLIGM